MTQLLSFARKESPAGQPLNVEELVRSVADLFRASASEQGIALDCEVRVQAELAGRSVAALRDALSNLLLNALQATPQGGKVELIAASANGDLVISVQDSGSGVPADLRERIWEPFFTTRQRGTGLGLAIVRKRVQEVGGSASLETGHNGRGALFQLRLPLSSNSFICVNPRLNLCFRMCFVVDLDQLLHRDVSVNLRGRETRVAQQFLDIAKIGATVE